MINAAANFTERYFALEQKKRAFLGRAGRNGKRGRNRERHYKEFHGMASCTSGLIFRQGSTIAVARTSFWTAVGSRKIGAAMHARRSAELAVVAHSQPSLNRRHRRRWCAGGRFAGRPISYRASRLPGL